MTTKSSLKTKDLLKAEDGGDVITKAELDTLKADAAKASEAEQALADVEKQKEDMATQLADLQKQKEEMAAQLADVEKAKYDQKLTTTVDVVKGFNLFEEENVEDVAKFLVDNDNAVTALLVKTLEKARVALDEFGTTEHGSDLEGAEIDQDDALSNAVRDVIKSRKAAK